MHIQNHIKLRRFFNHKYKVFANLLKQIKRLVPKKHVLNLIILLTFV